MCAKKCKHIRCNSFCELHKLYYMVTKRQPLGIIGVPGLIKLDCFPLYLWYLQILWHFSTMTDTESFHKANIRWSCPSSRYNGEQSLAYRNISFQREQSTDEIHYFKSKFLSESDKMKDRCIFLKTFVRSPNARMYSIYSKDLGWVRASFNWVSKEFRDCTGFSSV